MRYILGAFRAFSVQYAAEGVAEYQPKHLANKNCSEQASVITDKIMDRDIPGHIGLYKIMFGVVCTCAWRQLH